MYVYTNAFWLRQIEFPAHHGPQIKAQQHAHYAHTSRWFVTHGVAEDGADANYNRHIARASSASSRVANQPPGVCLDVVI